MCVGDGEMEGGGEWGYLAVSEYLRFSPAGKAVDI